MANALRSGDLTREVIQKAGMVIDRNVRSQTRVIDDLLDASAIITGKLPFNTEPVSLSAVIQAALDTIRPAAAAKQIRVECRIEEEIILVGDPRRLQQIVWNLLSNAVKFSPQERSVRLSVRRIGQEAHIEVTDQGIGIDPEFLPYVFDRFRQADSSVTRAVGGLGLGLAIAKGLVELHGGTIQAYSAGRGEGASFQVILPIMTVSPVRTESGGGSATSRSRKLEGLQILVVDDDVDSCELLRFVLANQGAEIIVAASAHEALQALGTCTPDVIVSDIAMAGTSGYELIEKIRSSVGDIPAIALTGYADSKHRDLALRAGFQMHVTKPVDLPELVDAILSLAGRTPK